jgi:hypothetical protein
LRDVLGIGRRARHAPCNPIDALVVPSQQCLEGGPLARNSGGDELAIRIDGRGVAWEEARTLR